MDDLRKNNSIQDEVTGVRKKDPCRVTSVKQFATLFDPKVEVKQAKHAGAGRTEFLPPQHTDTGALVFF